MEDCLYLFLKIALVHFFGVSSPGPDFALVLRNSLMASRRAGVYTSLGIMLGIAVHLSYCIFGLLFIIKQSLLLFTVLKYLCAAYLFYLGFQALSYQKQKSDGGSKLSDLKTAGRIHAVRQGFICNLFNPKAALFFWSLFSVLIDPTVPLWLQLAMAAEMMAVNFLWFAFIALMATHSKLRAPVKSFQGWATRLMGMLLIYFGIELAFTRLDP